jgi:iron complex outermembrane recepter protein
MRCHSTGAFLRSALLLGVSLIAFTGAATAKDDKAGLQPTAEQSPSGTADPIPNPATTQSADAVAGLSTDHAAPDGLIRVAQAGPAAQSAVTQTARAQAPVPPTEQLIVTGSLIRGTQAVGVPVTTLSPQDFVQTGSLTTADLFRDVPAAVVQFPSEEQGGGNAEKEENVNLHNLDADSAVRSLLMVDGIRVPPAGHGTDANDPSIVPSIALDRLDVLVDGASATYGSDAISGVINIILKRGYDGLETQFRAGTAMHGGDTVQFDGLFGRTWDTGDVTVSFEWYNQAHMGGSAIPGLRVDYSPWGLDNRIPIVSSIPGTVSVGDVPDVSEGTNCGNCYSIPTGQNGQNLTWAEIAAHPGVSNLIDPYLLGWATPSQQRTAATITFDQKITPNIQFFADGWYTNRRSQMLEAEIVADQGYNTYFVPSTNPYFPAGAPLTCPNPHDSAGLTQPCGLYVSYSFANEIPPHQSSFERYGHWDGGLNFTLPYGWFNKTYYSQTEAHSQTWFLGQGQFAAAEAALGNTIVPGAGYDTFTKPANVPYLNLFCDPNANPANTCNAQSTLDYITGFRQQAARSLIKEADTSFDGPVFNLPGGPVRVAVGADYSWYNTTYIDNNEFNQPVPKVALQSDPEARTVWAVFTQLNIPVFSAMNAIPGFQRLEFEGSWRHDGYSDVGGTSNPKLSVTWMPFDALTLRGSWGTSFRAPSFGEVSPVSHAQIHPINAAAGGLNGDEISIQCGANNEPTPGSVAYTLWQAGAACGSSPGGIYLTGGAGNSAQVRGGIFIKPEIATNYAGGVEFAPTAAGPLGFLRGLDLSATYYSVRIAGVLQAFRSNQHVFNDPGYDFLYHTASTDSNFAQIVAAILARPRSEVLPQYASAIQWIEDGGTTNAGWLKQTGVDFNGSYDWDMGDFGTGDVGIVGTYTLHNLLFSGIAGQSPEDLYNTSTTGPNGSNVNGVELFPRLTYRARLGWTSVSDTYSATLFMNYRSHDYSQEDFPPAQYLVNFPNYSNINPSQISFDLSLGYKTGTDPENDYLKNIDVQLVIQDIFDKHTNFLYNLDGGSTYFGGGNPSAQPDFADLVGRVISVTITKDW